MSLAQSSHGVLLAMELDPSGSPGTFTTIAELIDLTWPSLDRPETEVSPHNDTIDTWSLSSLLQRGPVGVEVNFIYNNGTHDSTTGVIAALVANETRGFMFRGTNWAAGTDEIIGSGKVNNFQQVTPVRAGQRTATFNVRLSGPMIVEGVTVGTVG